MHRCVFYPNETITKTLPVEMDASGDGEQTLTTPVSYYCRTCLRVVYFEPEEGARPEGVAARMKRGIAAVGSVLGSVVDVYTLLRNRVRDKAAVASRDEDDLYGGRYVPGYDDANL